MAEIATVARPYAEAVFELARQAGALDTWSDALALAASVAADDDMKHLADDPAFGKERFTELFLSVCADRISAEAGNFIRLLVDNGRIAILPEVALQYETLKAAATGEKDAVVTSAWPMTDTQTQELASSLQKKFGCKVNVTVEVDPGLIGGVIITVGDEVYDASVRGKLQEMAYTLNR